MHYFGLDLTRKMQIYGLLEHIDFIQIEHEMKPSIIYTNLYLLFYLIGKCLILSLITII